MPSKKLFTALRVLTPYFTRLGITQYIWIPQQELFYKSNRNKASRKLYGAFLCTYYFFLCMQTVRFYQLNDTNSVLVTITQTAAMSAANLCFHLTVSLGDIAFPLANAFLLFFNHMESKSNKLTQTLVNRKYF